MSCALVEMAIGRGDVVAVVLPNGVELLTVMFAVWRLGAALTPVNPALTKHEAQYQVADSVPDWSWRMMSRCRRSRAASRVCAWSTSSCDQMARPTLGPPTTEPEQLALVIYTGGTTGRRRA